MRTKLLIAAALLAAFATAPAMAQTPTIDSISPLRATAWTGTPGTSWLLNMPLLWAFLLGQQAGDMVPYIAMVEAGASCYIPAATDALPTMGAPGNSGTTPPACPYDPSNANQYRVRMALRR